jgi:hypothetical protein
MNDQCKTITKEKASLGDYCNTQLDITHSTTVVHLGRASHHLKFKLCSVNNNAEQNNECSILNP